MQNLLVGCAVQEIWGNMGLHDDARPTDALPGRTSCFLVAASWLVVQQIDVGPSHGLQFPGKPVHNKSCRKSMRWFRVFIFLLLYRDRGQYSQMQYLTTGV